MRLIKIMDIPASKCQQRIDILNYNFHYQVWTDAGCDDILREPTLMRRFL